MAMNRRHFLLGATAALATPRPMAQSLDVDYIIVGAGSSGCVLAHRLSADADVRVLVLEAGPADPADETIATPGRWVTLLGSRFDWAYQTEPEPGLNGRPIAFPRGKVVGGSSAINAMTFIRGHRLDFDRWEAAGNRGWGFDDVLALFRRSERNSRGSSAYHGGDGLLAVSDTRDPHAAHHAFLDAARAHGYDARPDWDFNGERQENAAGFYQKNIASGRRHSAADAFLRPALERTNCELRAGTHVTKVLVERGRAVGVEYVRDGAREQVRAAREVILSAGVIESPKLLMLSGIGPATHLRSMGVPVVADLSDVGRHLQDHLKLSIRYRGLTTLPPSTVTAGLFVHSRDVGGRADRSPDLQFYVGRGLDQPDTFVTVTVSLVQPASRGTVQLRSDRSLDAPIIQAHYLREQADVDALVAGTRLVRALVATKAYGTLRAEETEPGAATTTDAELASFARRAADTIYHAAGTCRMGTDAAAVVDPSLRVRGIDGLRVADASIMPSVVNATTHAACVMIGEKCAELIREAPTFGGRP
jgi:choline dehydrogenase